MTQELAGSSTIAPAPSIRVAPHFYFTEDEVDYTVAELANILRGA